MRKTCVVLAAAIVMASMHALASDWPNEPEGSTALTESSFDCIACEGWSFNDDPRTTIDSDTSSPSPPSVLQMRFTIGLPGGNGVGNVYYPLNSLQELYAGFWWKPGTSWNGGTGGQKLNFMMGGNGKWNIVMLLNPDHTINIYFPNSVGVDNCHLPGVWGDCPGTVQVYANVFNPTITLGAWHRMELYIKQSTSPTSRDGIIRWWIDGALCGDFANVNFPADRLVQYEFDATWGNIGDVNEREFFFWYDDARLSVPGPGQLYCGDGNCNNGEACTTCSQDCGSCSTGKPGDLNSDGRVDIFDLTLVASNYGKTSGYDSRADANNDGKIDIFDLVAVAKYFGT